MALFNDHHGRQHQNVHPYPRRQMADPLPEPYKHLDEALCHCLHNHPLPVRMIFSGWGTSDHGQPMAIYACPYQGCGARQGWVRDFRTNRPYRLFSKQPG